MITYKKMVGRKNEERGKRKGRKESPYLQNPFRENNSKNKIYHKRTTGNNCSLFLNACENWILSYVNEVYCMVKHPGSLKTKLKKYLQQWPKVMSRNCKTDKNLLSGFQGDVKPTMKSKL